MGAQKLRMRRKSTLGYTPWLRLIRTWSLSTLGPLKEASVFTVLYFVNSTLALKKCLLYYFFLYV